MLKLTILLLVLVWAGGVFFGSRKRLIRDVNQLLDYLAWAVLFFLGISILRQIDPGRDSVWVKALALGAWGGGAFLLVRALRLWLSRNDRRGKGGRR